MALGGRPFIRGIVFPLLSPICAVIIGVNQLFSVRIASLGYACFQTAPNQHPDPGAIRSEGRIGVTVTKSGFDSGACSPSRTAVGRAPEPHALGRLAVCLIEHIQVRAFCQNARVPTGRTYFDGRGPVGPVICRPGKINPVIRPLIICHADRSVRQDRGVRSVAIESCIDGHCGQGPRLPLIVRHEALDLIVRGGDPVGEHIDPAILVDGRTDGPIRSAVLAQGGPGHVDVYRSRDGAVIGSEFNHAHSVRCEIVRVLDKEGIDLLVQTRQE